MNLKHAANHFNRTWIDGYNGTTWVPNIVKVTLLPYDRFISERDFGVKRRHLLTNPDYPIPAIYPVIRFANKPDHVYLVARDNSDILATEYSQTVLIHRAFYTGQLITLTRSTAASGAVSAVTRTVTGTYYCDAENITFAASKEVPNIKFGDSVVVLPAGTQAFTTQEVNIGNEQYEIEQVYQSVGLTYCRCITKRPQV